MVTLLERAVERGVQKSARLAPVYAPSQRLTRTVGCALALLVYSGGVRANETLGTLTGRVFETTTNLPVAGAVVTATSPQLIGKQVAVTDATGTYWLPQLPPGVYTLNFAAEKLQSDYCPEIALNVDQTLRIDIFLIPEGLHGNEKFVPCHSPQR